MNKRGQVTLFIIIGIILLLVIGVVVYYRDSISEFTGLSGSMSYPSEVEELLDHVQECVDDSADEAVLGIGYTGGYYTLPSETFYYEGLAFGIPYYYYDGEDLTISLELSEYFMALIDVCVTLDEFSEFDIDEGDGEVSVEVDSNMVTFLYEFPVELAVEDSLYTLDEPYESVVDANLGWLREVAAAIVEHTIETPDKIDYDFILEQGVTSVTVAPMDDETIVYIFEDTTSYGGEQNYTFMYAEYYPGLEYLGECEEDYDCEEGYVCSSGFCVEGDECEEDDDCSEDYICVSEVCEQE